ncbi:membrane hypothetical protein [Mesorhizobium sp. STM 4661]|nr:membrane hypothetical protein [Mesorhizobium sp. STM 4661]
MRSTELGRRLGKALLTGDLQEPEQVLHFLTLQGRLLRQFISQIDNFMQISRIVQRVALHIFLSRRPIGEGRHPAEPRIAAMDVTYDSELTNSRSAWSAVISMALCVAVLIASEFMPVSLLSPIAADLGITAGQTGQAISISGAFAVVTSLFIAGLTRRIDRRIVVLAFTGLLVVSGLAVTFAPDYAFLMVGRALLGMAIGGFWSMSTAIRDASTAGRSGAQGPCPAERWQCHRSNDCGPARKLPWRLCRLAGSLLHGRPTRPAGAGLAVDQPACIGAAARPGYCECLYAAWTPSCRAGHGLHPVLLHGPVRAVYLSASVPRTGYPTRHRGSVRNTAGDGTGRRRWNLVHRSPAEQAALQYPDSHSDHHGAPGSWLGLIRCSPDPRILAAFCLGLLWHRCTRRLGHLVDPRHARRCRGWRRPAGGRDPACNHGWRGNRRLPFRRCRLVEHFRAERRPAVRFIAPCGGGLACQPQHSAMTIHDQLSPTAPHATFQIVRKI